MEHFARLKSIQILIAGATLLSQLSCHGLEKGENMDKVPSGTTQKAMEEYYTTQGIITDPCAYAYFYQNLPSDVGNLCKVSQHLMIHIFHAHRYGVELTEEKKKEVLIRKVEDMLERMIALDDLPITSPRNPDKRLVGNCRDFAVLTCSLLRHQGIPARVRCGFSTCLSPGTYEDHWICEYWSSGQRRWVQFDPQLDSLLVEALHVEFNPLDMPSGTFLTGGEAWKRCRSGGLDPDQFGIGDLKGLWFIRGNVLRDLMALNKFEVLPWDCSALMEGEKPLSPEEYALVDKVAELTTADPIPLHEIRSLYESDARLRMPEGWEP